MLQSCYYAQTCARGIKDLFVLLGAPRDSADMFTEPILTGSSPLSLECDHWMCSMDMRFQPSSSSLARTCIQERLVLSCSIQLWQQNQTDQPQMGCKLRRGLLTPQADVWCGGDACDESRFDVCLGCFEGHRWLKSKKQVTQAGNVLMS